MSRIKEQTVWLLSFHSSSFSFYLFPPPSLPSPSFPPLPLFLSLLNCSRPLSLLFWTPGKKMCRLFLAVFEELWFRWNICLFLYALSFSGKAEKWLLYFHSMEHMVWLLKQTQNQSWSFGTFSHMDNRDVSSFHLCVLTFSCPSTQRLEIWTTYAIWNVTLLSSTYWVSIKSRAMAYGYN